MTYRINFLSVWNSIKKLPSLLSEASDDLRSATAIPWLLDFFKKFLQDYRKNRRNSWEHQITLLQSKDWKTDDEKKRYLIRKFNESLFFHSKDKANPWIIDDTSKDFIKLKKKNVSNINIELEFSKANQSAHYSQAQQSIELSLPPTSGWERANRFADKNFAMQIFKILWDTVSSHANLLKWISLFFITFSISFHFFPVIMSFVGLLAIGYLGSRFYFAFKKTSKTSDSSLLPGEEENLIFCIKQDVFNKEKYKHDFDLIQKLLTSPAIELTKVYEYLVFLEKQAFIQSLQQLQLEKSSIYQYLSRVKPKTQFISALIINLNCLALYGYLVSWAISVLFKVIGLITLAGLVTSPPGLAILVSIPIGFFLVRHLIKSLSREQYYQKKIYSLLNVSCEYSFIDSKNQRQKFEVKKWQKFEYLLEEIHLLEKTLGKILLKVNIDRDSPFYFLFKDHSENASDIYKLNYEDKTQCKKIPVITKVKKLLNRLIFLVMGGFYGYCLGQKIALQTSLGMSSTIQVAILPIIVVILPLIIINAVANLVSYHLNTRQRSLLFFAEQLDSKLQILEYRKEKLLYLCAILGTLKTASGNKKTTAQRAEDPDKAIKFNRSQSNVPKLQSKIFKPLTSQLADTISPEKEHHQLFCLTL